VPLAGSALRAQWAYRVDDACILFMWPGASGKTLQELCGSVWRLLWKRVDRVASPTNKFPVALRCAKKPFWDTYIPYTPKMRWSANDLQSKDSKVIQALGSSLVAWTNSPGFSSWIMMPWSHRMPENRPSTNRPHHGESIGCMWCRLVQLTRPIIHGRVTADQPKVYARSLGVAISMEMEGTSNWPLIKPAHLGPFGAPCGKLRWWWWGSGSQFTVPARSLAQSATPLLSPSRWLTNAECRNQSWLV